MRAVRCILPILLLALAVQAAKPREGKAKFNDPARKADVTTPTEIPSEQQTAQQQPASQPATVAPVQQPLPTVAAPEEPAPKPLQTGAALRVAPADTLLQCPGTLSQGGAMRADGPLDGSCVCGSLQVDGSSNNLFNSASAWTSGRTDETVALLSNCVSRAINNAPPPEFKYVEEGDSPDFIKKITLDVTTDGLIRLVWFFATEAHEFAMPGSTITLYFDERVGLKMLVPIREKTTFPVNIESNLTQVTYGTMVTIRIPAFSAHKCGKLVATFRCKQCDDLTKATPCCGAPGFYRLPGSQCRPAQGPCMAPGTCNGTSSSCPPSIPVMNGVQCPWLSPEDMKYGAYMSDASKLRRKAVSAEVARSKVVSIASASPQYGDEQVCYGVCQDGNCMMDQEARACCREGSYGREEYPEYEPEHPEYEPEPKYRRGPEYPEGDQGYERKRDAGYGERKYSRERKHKYDPEGARILSADAAPSNWHCWE